MTITDSAAGGSLTLGGQPNSCKFSRADNAAERTCDLAAELCDENQQPHSLKRPSGAPCSLLDVIATMISSKLKKVERFRRNITLVLRSYSTGVCSCEKLSSFDDDSAPPYAILSHTWTKQEVTYNELVSGTGKGKTGYAKIRFCVDKAAEDGLQYSWVDTCCIDKTTSDELQEAINSMFRWYQRAKKCYAYLSDVLVPAEVTDAQAFRTPWMEAFQQSRWFKRGWTLQELIAPPTVEFFSQNEKQLGDRISLEQEIHEITKIPIGALRGQRLSEFSPEERMSWAAYRTTTKKEDKAYCLLGIFGLFLPLIYGEGEEHAIQRLKEQIQKGQERQGTKKLQDLTVLSSLPFPRNEFFVGRRNELQSLEQFLLPDIHRRMTICGLGGCGKSALALEFAYRALTRHVKRLVFWVPAISQESFELAYREIGTRLCIQGIADDNADVKQLVKNVLNSDNIGNWLMIIDNADDPGVLMGSAGGSLESGQLRDYLPSSPQGQILFTTRSRKVAGDLTPSRVLELKDMSEAEARQLLEQRISKQALHHNEKAVNEFLKMLAYLPLAIVQAAAFINNNNISVSEYISLFQEAGTKAELFSEHFEDPSRYREMESTIAKTWYLSFDQIRKQDPLAAEYLSFIACIDRINIPQSLFPSGGSRIQQTKAIGTLKGYTFITEHQQALQELRNEKFFDMHRLVHMVSEWWLEGHDEQSAWTAKAATRLEELIPYGGHEGKEEWTTYLPHAIYMAGLDNRLDEIDRDSLLDRIGRCQESLGQYSAAETTHRQVLSLRERRLGKKDGDTFASMSQVGVALWYQGKYEEAEAMQQQTLMLREKILGPEHQDTLTSVEILALVLGDQGKYGKAESMHRQALAGYKKVLGAEHPSTLTSMSNLAGVLDSQGKYEEAESMNRQTLEQREKVLGAEHPSTLTSMSNLAGVLRRHGKYEEAESMNRQTLEQREKVLGAEHPDTLTSMSNLALVLRRQGKYEEAESMNRQTLEQREKVLGAKHPDTLTSMSNLALVLDSQGNFEEAESMNQQTLERREKVLGAEHPSTLTSMSNLAGVLRRQGKYEEAESMNRQELAITKKVLGAEHPDTLTSMSNLAGVLDSQGKYEEAELMNRQMLEQREKVLGAKHPDTLTSMSNLAGVLRRQGNFEEAESMNRQTLEQREKVLGAKHPDTLTSMSNLALVLDSQGNFEEAESMNRQTLERREKVLGAEHPSTLTSMSNLALVLDSQGKYEEAESINRQTLTRREKVLGPEHPDTLTSVYNLAYLLANRQRYDESATLYERACAGYSGVLGNDHPTTRACHEHFSDMLALQMEDELSRPLPDTSNPNMQTKKISILSRGLAKIGI
ncbi:hypothetical protein F5884DRAFT_757854 [Xylogone sp. PMI_703]|nr:hypothetical protein F5884DRAFT_757854 [Xylogone sp. PMI_703]